MQTPLLDTGSDAKSASIRAKEAAARVAAAQFNLVRAVTPRGPPAVPDRSGSPSRRSYFPRDFTPADDATHGDSDGEEEAGPPSPAAPWKIQVAAVLHGFLMNARWQLEDVEAAARSCVEKLGPPRKYASADAELMDMLPSPRVYRWEPSGLPRRPVKPLPEAHLNLEKLPSGDDLKQRLPNGLPPPPIANFSDALIAEHRRPDSDSSRPLSPRRSPRRSPRGSPPAEEVEASSSSQRSAKPEEPTGAQPPVPAAAPPPAPSPAPPPAPPPAAAPPPPTPPPGGPQLVACHIGYTHPGGSKPLDAKNQDTYFHLKIDEHNQVFGVLDGHGADYGTLVAEVASDAIKAYISEHFDQLRTAPEAVFDVAFEKAHEAAREAVLSQEDYFATVGEGKVVVDAWETANGEQDMDAVDGGTTATVIALLDGCKLVMAQVGDSSALLGGTVEGEEGEEGGGEVTFEELMEEHSATNATEYERVLASGPRGKLLRFVYDVDDDDQPPIFKQRNTKPGAPPPVPKYELNEASRLRAVELETPPKNCRGDLPTILLTPKKDVTYPKLEPITLAMTRSIGDFYLHTFGVTWKPEVRTMELSDLIMKKSGGGKGGKLTNLTLILASDGIWDLYENSEVFDAIVSKPTVLSNGKRKQSISNAKAFFDKSVEKGAEIFGSSADNMTGIVVYLNPIGTEEEGKAPPPITPPKFEIPAGLQVTIPMRKASVKPRMPAIPGSPRTPRAGEEEVKPTVVVAALAEDADDCEC